MRIKLYKDFIIEREISYYDSKFGITPELESDVKDIFVELRDEGIEVDVQSWESRSGIIYVSLSPISDREKNSFKVSLVKEYVMMLIDYMNLKYDVKKVTYDVDRGDFDNGETKTYSYDEFPEGFEMVIDGEVMPIDLDTDEFCINFVVEDWTINESFNKLDVIKGNIEDIFVELIDDGFLLDVNTVNYDKWLSTGSIYVYLEHKDEFRVDDVKDYIMMLNDYMKLEFNRFMTLYSLDYMHSDSSYSSSMQFEYFPTGNSTDINNLRIHYIFPSKSLNEGFGDFKGTDFDKIESDVNDMFIDLKDSGAKIWIDFYHKGIGYGTGPDDYMIKVWIYSDRKFSMTEVEEPTRMVIDYFHDLTGKRIDMEYNMMSDYTNTRQTEFSPYSFDNEITIYFIERG